MTSEPATTPIDTAADLRWWNSDRARGAGGGALLAAAALTGNVLLISALILLPDSAMIGADGQSGWQLLVPWTVAALMLAELGFLFWVGFQAERTLRWSRCLVLGVLSPIYWLIPAFVMFLITVPVKFS